MIYYFLRAYAFLAFGYAQMIGYALYFLAWVSRRHFPSGGWLFKYIFMPYFAWSWLSPFWPFIGSFSTCCFLGRVPHIYYGYYAYFCSANSLILVLSQFRLIVRGKNASCDGSGLSLHENILLICYLFANLLWTCNFCLIFIFKQFFLWFLCDFLLYFSHWDYEMYRTNIWVWNC